MTVNDGDKQSADADKKSAEPAVTRRPGPAHWIAALICLVYGFAKINGSQFTILDSELTKPMGEVSGFWLTWYYFGYSPFYGTLIALIQIGAGILLVCLEPRSPERSSSCRLSAT
jgi:hypothetical protein